MGRRRRLWGGCRICPRPVAAMVSAPTPAQRAMSPPVAAVCRYGERSLAVDQRLFVERKVHREKRTVGERR